MTTPAKRAIAAPAASPQKAAVQPVIIHYPEGTPIDPRSVMTEADDLRWAERTEGVAGDYELIPAPEPGKRIVIYFYRRGNVGEGENRIAFRWGQDGALFFQGRMWYCGVELAYLGAPRKGPENKALYINLTYGTTSEPRSIETSVAYKIEEWKRP